MKRFFYFGCSFTNFGWPTWGDLIAIDLINHHGFDYAVNYGRGGACNTFILNQLNDCLDTNDITDEDIFAVSWSTMNRQSWLGVDLNPNVPTTGKIHWHTAGEYIQNNVIQSTGIKEKNFWPLGVHSTLQAYTMFHKLVKPTYEMRLSHRPFVVDDSQLNRQVSYDFAMGDFEMSDHPTYIQVENLMRDRFKKFVNLPKWLNESKDVTTPGPPKRIPENFNYHPEWLQCEFIPGHPDIYMHFNMASRFHDFHPDTVKLVDDFIYKHIQDFKKVNERNPKNHAEWRKYYSEMGDQRFFWPDEISNYGIKQGSPQW